MRVSDLNIDRIYMNQLIRASTYKMVENHFHYYYELFYVRQGGCRFFINNTLYDLYAGDFLIIPPREVHFNRYLSTCTRINIYFKEADLARGGRPFLPGLSERFLKLAKVHIPSAFQGSVNSVIDSMLLEEKVDDEDTKAMMEALLRQFLILSDRHGVFHYENTNTGTGDGDEGILAAARYITEHYNQPITLDSLSRVASLSPSYFSKKFRQTTGMGMKEYLSYVRLQHAAAELLSTTHTITDVAINCGFSDSNYFKDAFRKQYGMSPRAFRNSRKTDIILEESIRTQPQR
ncbi:AraC-like ligand binding domain-containing protein [Lachnospiraceae bacterium NK3A20]|jgi:AraC-like DNA-binding protein|nr:AraC-like ligand binding domain-containing protein [Lachnospiraceae bacterium NK3A20]